MGTRFPDPHTIALFARVDDALKGAAHVISSMDKVSRTLCDAIRLSDERRATRIARDGVSAHAAASPRQNT